MKGPNPKTSAELSDLESRISLRGENGALLSGEADPQLELDERQARDRKIARLRLLWESRGLLVRVSGLALLLSAGITLLIPNQYKSTARLMPPDNQSSSGLAAAAMAFAGGSGGTGGLGAEALGGLGGLAGQLLGLKSTSDLLVGVLTSRSVADTIVEKFDLKKVYGARRMDDAWKALESHTSTEVDRKSQIVTIMVTDQDPARATAITAEFIEQLNRRLAEVSTSSARRERVFLEGRLKGVSRDLESAEKEFSQFSSKNSTLDIKEQGKAMVEAAAALQGELIAARSELEGLKQIYADSNVRVRSLEARIAELENEIRRVGGQNEGDLLTASANQNDSLYPSIRKLPLLGVTYADLYRKARVQETVFEMLTQEYEVAKVEEAKEIPMVKVLDPPNLPESKSSPPRTLLTLLGGFIGFVAGATYVFARARWQETDPSDPGKVLAQEVLETVRAVLPWHSRNGFNNGANSDGRDSKKGF
jgi:uncharacterized protein involved in exopolysaccharide biosynthesis